MNDDQIKNALFKLIKVNNALELTSLLQRDVFFKDSAWWPYADTESNFSIISALSKDPVNALVEKIVNSIDAMLMAECLKRDINPKEQEAPESMREAVEEFFNIKEGNISSLSDDERHSLAQKIRVIAQGTKKEPSISIVDLGEGQNPENFLDTFLSLPGGKSKKSNKVDIKFVQGNYNMGGSGALMFCGSLGNTYQLILSKRNPNIKDFKNVWGFTLVRETAKEGSKKSHV